MVQHSVHNVAQYAQLGRQHAPVPAAPALDEEVEGVALRQQRADVGCGGTGEGEGRGGVGADAAEVRGARCWPLPLQLAAILSSWLPLYWPMRQPALQPILLPRL